MTEKEFMEEVRDLAKLYGWFFYHTNNSRRSTAGFPDLVLIKPPLVIFAELKAEKGRLTQEQRNVMEMLSKCENSRMIAVVWKPSDIETIAEVLSGIRKT